MSAIITASNKTQIPLKIKNVSGTSEIVPFIDKLSVTLNFEADVVETFYNKVLEAIQFKSIFQSAKATSDFQITRNIALNCTEERVLFQAISKNTKTPHCRMEFNPHKIGWQGVNDLDKSLEELFLGGWDYVVKQGSVTRIDIAVDLPGIEMDQFLFVPSQGTTSLSYKGNGHLETLYIGKSKGNQTRIYDKAKQLAKKEKKLIGHPLTRVERTLRNPNLKVGELKGLSNAFSSIVLIPQIPKCPAGESPDRWAMFGDSVHIRGVLPAMALLPELRRAKYRKYLKEHAAPWWDPAAIWANWPKALIELM